MSKSDALNCKIKMSSEAHLSTINHRQKRRPEDRDAIDDAWDMTFGKLCDRCGRKHAAKSPCREDGDA